MLTHISKVWLILIPLSFSCSGGGGGDSQNNPPGNQNVEMALNYDNGEPYAVAGVKVFVDDVQIGTTDDQGKLAYTFLPGTHTVRALDPSAAMGTADLGDPKPTTIEVSMLGDLERPSKLTCTQVAGGVLQEDEQVVSFALNSPLGTPIEIAELSVSARDARAEGPEVDVTPWVETTQTGIISVTDVPSFISAVSSFTNDAEVTASGLDSDGAEFKASDTFFVGQHQLKVTLNSPPSNPSLVTAGVPVSAELIGTEVKVSALSDSGGSVTFSLLPMGTYHIFAESVQDGLVYTASIPQFMASNANVVATMLGLEDVLNGVAGLESTFDRNPSAIPRKGPLPSGPANWSGRNAQEGSGFPGNSISVESRGENQVVANQTSVAIPQGTATIELIYEVVSVEYPYYVLSQSEYNDNWTIKLLSPTGAHLYNLVRNVNSQIHIEPYWISGTEPGTTGVISDEIDVSSLTQTGNINVALSISATNIGDSILPTYVTAGVQVADFKIGSIIASKVAKNEGCNPHNYAQKEQLQFSIPYAGKHNDASRTLTAELIGRPEGADVSNVKVQLMDAGTNTVLAVILNEAPSQSGLVQHVETSSSDVVKLKVTNGAGHPSQVAGIAPADKLEYEITVEVSDDGTPLSASKRSPAYNALWKAVLGPRTGCPDKGGDDWSSKATISWLASNLGLLAPVNDISGEHDRNLGHSTHNLGKAIDTRQFTTSALAFSSGVQIYNGLKSQAAKAMQGDSAALGVLNDWFSANRAGLAPLIANSGVDLVYVAASPKASPLPAGWFLSLLKDGTVTSGAAAIALPIGAWQHPGVAKVKPLGGHLDHFHFALNL